MPVTPVAPVPVDENVGINYPPNTIQPGLAQIVVADTTVNIVPPYTPNQSVAAFQEQLIFEIQSQKIQIAQLQADNTYLKNQLNQVMNNDTVYQDTILENLYFA